MSNGKMTMWQAQADLRLARAEAQEATAAALKAQEVPSLVERPATFAAALKDLMDKFDYLRAEWIRAFDSADGFNAWFTEKTGL